MGLFNTYSTVKHGNQKITPNFLKHLGFKKYKNWGSPSNWNNPESEFWEKILVVRKNNGEIYHHVATLLYFPPEFDGYVPEYNTRGVSPKNKIIGFVDNGHGEDLTGDACCKMDIHLAIDALTNMIIDYEEIMKRVI